MFSCIFSDSHFFLCFPQLFERASENGSEYFHSSLFTGTVLSALHVLTHLIIVVIVQGRFYYPHFVDEEMKIQRG